MKQKDNMQEIQEVIKDFDRKEHAQEERDRSNGLYYSIESDTAFVDKHALNSYGRPEKELIKEEARQILYDALNSLPRTQVVRIYGHFFDNQSYSHIARSEGVDESAVRRSIERGLIQLRKKLSGTGISKNDFACFTTTRYIKHRRKKKSSDDESTVDKQKSTVPLINSKEDEGGEQDEILCEGEQ